MWVWIFKFIFEKIFQVEIFIFLLPAVDFEIILLLSGFKKFFYRIFEGLFSKLLYSNFEIGKKIWGKTILLYDPHRLLDKCLTTPVYGGL